MDLQTASVLVLGALPFLLVVLHGLVARAFRLVGIDLGAQLTAIVIVVLLDVAIAVLTIRWLKSGSLGLSDVVYLALTANAMWFVYFQVFVNLSLTSLHARLLLAGLWNGPVEPRDLAREYDSKVMLTARLERLLKMRQIARAGDVIFLDWPFLLWLSYPLYWWRGLIGLEGEQLQLGGGADGNRPAKD